MLERRHYCPTLLVTHEFIGDSFSYSGFTVFQILQFILNHHSRDVVAIKFHFHICHFGILLCHRSQQVYNREVEVSSKLACHLVIYYTLDKKSAILQQQSKKKTAVAKVQVKVLLYLKRSVVSGMILDSLF